MPAEPLPPDRLEFCRPSELPGVEILRGHESHRKFTVFHEHYAVSSIYQSCGDWLYRNRTHWMQPDELCLMEPGEIHRNLRTYGTSRFRVLFLPPELVVDAAAEIGLPAAPPRLRHPRVGDPALSRRFRALHDSLERPSTMLERQSRLAACLEGYLRTCMERRASESTGGADRARVARAVDYLRSRLGENCSLEELSGAAGLSRFHFLRVFKNETGVPPHEYQIQLRIAEARERLRRGQSPIQIAHGLGFSDQSHFTRHFRRVLGITPARFGRS